MDEHSFSLASSEKSLITEQENKKICFSAFSLKNNFNGFIYYNPLLTDGFSLYSD